MGRPRMTSMEHRRWITTSVVVGAVALAAGVWLRLGSASASASAGEPRTVEHAVMAPSASRAPAPAAPPRQTNPAPPRAALGDRAEDTPDITQTDPALALPGGGNSFCGPVAISNSLMYLAAHGYPALAPAGATVKERQVALVRLLGSPRYMGTGPRSGTGAMGVMHGLAKYVRHAGYEIARLEYEGWRQHPYEFTRHEPHPDLAWIGGAIAPRSAAWINVGWYKKSRYADAYRRNGGHWLAVVAAGTNDRGERDPGVLVLHDSAPYEDGGPLDVFARAARIDGGWMLDGSSAFPAKGYYVLGGGMYVKREGEVAIIDGAIVLELRPTS